jgi:hypothetical protein
MIAYLAMKLHDRFNFKKGGTMPSRRLILPLCCCFLVMLGCGPRTTPGGRLLGSGKLTHEGKPLNAVNISLVIPGETSVRAAGLTSPDGKFDLRAPDGGAGSLPASKYTVLLEATGGEGWAFSAGLQNPTTSPLTIEFHPGEEIQLEVSKDQLLFTGFR